MFFVLFVVLLVILAFISGFVLGTLHGIHKEQDRNNFFSNNHKSEFPEINHDSHLYDNDQMDIVEDAINSFKEEFQKEGYR